jgi:hypothetical protein
MSTFNITSPCLVIFVRFALASLGLTYLSTPNPPATMYLGTTFLNGLFDGALLNYTLSHVLHLTGSHVQYIVTALVAMFNGFAERFSSAVGGGFFARVLKASLEPGFSSHGLPPQPNLALELLGSPVLVMDLEGLEQEVSIASYEHAVQLLFLASGVVALIATVVQAGAGWAPEGIGQEIGDLVIEEDYGLK